MKHLLPVFGFLAGLASASFAGAPSAAVSMDKAQAEELRPFEPDRPDQTEGPFTVDAGHLQIELDFANVSLNRSAGERSTTWNALPVMLRLGLTDNLDIAAAFDGWSWERTEDRASGRTQHRHGSGDTELSLKWNLWGNDGKSTTAFALLPYVTLPSARNGMGAGHTEAGIDFPLQWNLSEEWELGLMTAAQWIWNEDDAELNPVWVNSACLSRELTDTVSVFAEVYTECGHGPLLMNLNAGIMFQLPGDWQLDAGCYFGVTGETDDAVPFIGMAHRF